jgi:archaemetzincin
MISQKKIIAIQPLGDVRSDVLEVVAANLQAFFQIRTEVFSYQPIPDGAYNAHRGQYNCYPILKFLGTLKPDNTIKIVGVTEVDLFIPILTYVFGEGELGGNAAVISTYRLARGKDWEPGPVKRLFERAAKIAVHETAHTFRLPHCKEDRCIMNSFPVLDHIDEKPIYFCRYCVRFLRDEYEYLCIV